MVEIMNNVELVLWSSNDADKPSLTSVREALIANGLSSTYAEDIPPTTAFRRACDEQRNKTTLVRVFTKGGDLHCQIDKEVAGAERLERQFVGVYRCHATLSIRPVGTDSDLVMWSSICDAFAIARNTYEWGDVSTIIQNIINKCGLGAYSPRKNGGIYFLPQNPDRPALLTQIERLCDSIGIRFLRYAVPDTEAQRAEVMDAVAAGIEQDVVAHEQSVADYTDAGSSVLQKRKNGIKATLHLLNRLNGLIGDRYYALVDRLTALDERVSAMSGTAATAVVQNEGRRLTFS